MTEVENDTEEMVEYSHDEGPGTHGLVIYDSLAPGQVKALHIGGRCFNIYFNLADDRDHRIAVEKAVPSGRSLRLFRPSEGRWAVEIRLERKAVA